MKFFDRIVTWWRKYPRIADGLIILPLLGLMLLTSIGSMTGTFPIYLYNWPEWALDTVVVSILVLHMAPWTIRRTNPVASAGLVVLGSLIHLVLGPDLLPSMIMVVLTVQNLAHLAPSWASIAGLCTALAGAVLYAAETTMVPHFWGARSYSEGEVIEPSGAFYALPI
ncbi:MAG: hypothetical protein L0L05_05130, partial [Yaniella sp.]|nr:hypothetical protein [Yaniella sp.]